MDEIILVEDPYSHTLYKSANGYRLNVVINPGGVAETSASIQLSEEDVIALGAHYKFLPGLAQTVRAHWPNWPPKFQIY